MSERIARLQAHQRNIDRYEDLLKNALSELEVKFLQKRLSEERFAIAMLHFMSPPKGYPGALEQTKKEGATSETPREYS
jgi:hypothetical protein